MDEFLRLYLTGTRADTYQKSCLFRTVIGLLGAIFAVIPVFLSIFGVQNAPLSIVLTVLGFLLEAAAAVLSFFQKKLVDALVELENAAIEIEKQGEARECCRRLYAAWTETYGRRSLLPVFTAGLTVLGFAVLLTATLLASLLPLPAVFLPLMCIGAALLLAIPAILRVVGDGRLRTRLYERAGAELDELERTRLGLSEWVIQRQSEAARAYSMLPEPVAMFLKDKIEREEFRIANRRSGILGTLLGIGLFALTVAMSVPNIWERVDNTVECIVLIAVFLGWGLLFFALVLPFEARKRDIYRRNFEKLTDSRADALRRELQGAWIRQQRRGNIMFLCFLLLPVIAGIVFGAVWTAIGQDQSIVVSITSSFLMLLIPSAFLSLIVWSVMYGVYRRRVQPIEGELRRISEEERRNGREG